MFESHHWEIVAKNIFHSAYRNTTLVFAKIVYILEDYVLVIYSYGLA